MVVVALLVVLNLAVYSGVNAFAFVNWDDPVYITENPVVKGGLSAHSIWWALTSAHEPYWHPVTWMSHLADVSMFGLDAGMHHLVNAAIHTLNSVLVFVVLKRLTGRQWPSAVVAAVFAVHPLHVESVAWVTERKDVLSVMFFLLALWAYARYAEKPGTQRYLEVAAWFSLAAMSKPMAVTLPVVLLLIDFWPLKRGWRLVEKLPLLGISAAVSIATVAIQTRVGAVADVTAFGVWPRIANALVSYVRYLGKTIWPAGLTAFYPLEIWPVPVIAGAVVLLAAISAAAWRLRASRPHLLFGWLFFLVTLLPVIGVLQSGEQAIADRFMYLPMIGPLVALAFSVNWNGARRPHPALIGAAAVVIMAFAVVARAQALVWSDSVALWQHALAVDSANYIAHEKLGAAFRDLGRMDDARASFERSRAATPPNSPRFLAILDNLIGMTFQSQGRMDEARAKFADAVAENPLLAEAQTNLGNTLAASGRASEAIPHFDAALRLNGDDVESRVGRGNALAATGDIGGAQAEYETAIRLKPDLAVAHFNLAVLFAKAGRLVEARAACERALAADPNYAQARRLLDALAR